MGKRLIWLALPWALLLALAAGCAQGGAAPSESGPFQESQHSEKLPEFTDPDRPPAEAQLMRDLQDREEFPEAYGIHACEVIKSQTDKESGSYLGYVQVSARSEQAEIVRKYRLEYVLYDQGWLLEVVEPFEEDSWSHTPLMGMTEEELLEKLPANTEILSSRLEGSAQNVEFRYTEYHDLCTVTHTAEKSFYFSPEGEYWYDVAEPLILETTEDWDLTGKWIIRNGEYVDIFSMGALSASGIPGEVQLHYYNQYYSEAEGETLTAPFRKAESFAAETGLGYLSSTYHLNLYYQTVNAAGDRSGKTPDFLWTDQFPYVIDLHGPDLFIGSAPLYDLEDMVGNLPWTVESDYADQISQMIFVGYEGIAVSYDLYPTGHLEVIQEFKLLERE